MTVAANDAMLIGTCASRRNAASASLVSAAKPILNLSGLRNPNPSSPTPMTTFGVGAKPAYCWAVLSPLSGARAAET